MKKLVMLLLLVFVAGSSAEVTVITTPAELQAIGTNAATLDGDYVLGNDIDLTGITFTSIMEFTGTFDGNMHTINGLTKTTPGLRNTGIFGRTVAGSEIRNVGLTNVTVNYDASVANADYVGVLISDSKGLVDKCWVDGGSITVTGATAGNNSGSLIGLIRDTGSVTNCCVRGITLSINGLNGIGGFVNSNGGGLIENCYVDATSVDLTGRSFSATSGFGRDLGGAGIKSCYYNMDVTTATDVASNTVYNPFDDGSDMGRTTAQMRTQANYVGWDFENIWEMVEGQTTPILIGSGISVSNPSPANGAGVVPGDVELSWDNIVLDPPSDVSVEVLFGTEPNDASPNYDMVALVLDPVSGLNVSSVTVIDLADGTYYWRVNSDIGKPDMVKGPLWKFDVVSDPAPTIKSITPAQMTWSDKGVPLTATVINEGPSATIIEWVVAPDPNTTVTIEGGDTATPTVTITKAAAATGGVYTVTVTVFVSDGANPTPVQASVEIDVYDDACHMARDAEGKDNIADFNKDCDIDIKDLAFVAAKWLNDISLDEAIVSYSEPAEPNNVPNGNFEKLYKPGTLITGNFSDGGWNIGVGAACPIENGTYEFSDGTTGGFADIAGWVGYDVQGWIDNGGTYGRDQTRGPGDNQGSIAAQGNTTPGGNLCYLANGGGDGGWGNPAGGLITSAAPLATVNPARYTLSMMAQGGATPVVLDLLVDGVVITPNSSVDPVLSGEWQEFSRTYEPNALEGLLGQDLTIALGVGREATGTQSKFDDVSLDIEIIDENLPTVNAGDDRVTWSGESITLASTVTDNDTQVPARALSYLWTAKPADGVTIEGADTLTPTVTITKAPGDMVSVRLILAVTLEDAGTMTDAITVDVYDDSCKAAMAVDPLLEFDLTDLNKDCITNLEEFAKIAAAWLDDYSSTEPIARN